MEHNSLPNAFDHGMWEPFNQNADINDSLKGSLELRMQRIEDETCLRQIMVKYAYSYDSNNVDALMTIFSDDAVLINPRATFIGSAMIKRNYDHLITTRRYSFHHITNLMTRFSDDGTEALGTMYWTDKHVGTSGSIDGSDGTYVSKFRKTHGQWLIVELRITANIFYVMTPYPDPWPTLPEPSNKIGTREWVGPKYVR
jgi:ketosteroid isomerase-like protein